jgi:transketolase
MLSQIQVTGNKDTRSGFGDGILEAARKNPNIIALTADLLGSMKLNGFIKEFPDRFVQCGIAEANMIGIAAGLTIGGKIPYTTTFANFSTGRVYDQIRQSVAYSNKNVKICASHAGLTLRRRRRYTPDIRRYWPHENVTGYDGDRSGRL